MSDTFRVLAIFFAIGTIGTMASCNQHAKAFPIFATQAHAATYCNPERSKPCGGGCISLDKTCRKSWTTSKVGINPNRGQGPGYANPKYVEKAPK